MNVGDWATKGAILPHRKTFWNTFNDAMELLFDLTAISLVFIPLFHSGGLNIITMPTFYVRGPLSSSASGTPRRPSP